MNSRYGLVRNEEQAQMPTFSFRCMENMGKLRNTSYVTELTTSNRDRLTNSRYVTFLCYLSVDKDMGN